MTSKRLIPSAAGSAFGTLKDPYPQHRKIIVGFGRLPEGRYSVPINGQDFENQARSYLWGRLSSWLPGSARVWRFDLDRNVGGRWI
ncbi:hypothetical protein MYX84_06470 [Acidobacteria bacterium AH-259-O06]|nr:hypothetical protein [Acidobacteria bacterium AH-259-O06]